MSNRLRRRVLSDDEEEGGSDRDETTREGLEELPRTLAQVQALAKEYSLNPPALDGSHAKTVELMRKEHTNALKGITATIDELRKAAVACEETREEEDDTAENMVEELDTHVRRMVDAVALVEIRKEALLRVENSINRQQLGLQTPLKIYQDEVESKSAAYESKTTRQKYGTNTIYEDFRNAVWEARHDGEAMQPVILSIPAEPGDEDNEDDVVAGATTTNYRCPITQMLLEDPVTSQVCRHTYSAQAIKEMIQRANAAGASSTCPAGCDKPVRLSDLKPDTAMAERVKNFKRRQQQKEMERRATQVAGSILVD